MDTKNVAKVRLFGQALAMKDWKLNRHGCFNSKDAKGGQIRLNFRDPAILKSEKKILLTKEELKANKESGVIPQKKAKWVITVSGPYATAQLADGQLTFQRPAVNATKPK